MEPSCFALLVNSLSLLIFFFFCFVLVPVFDRGRYGIYSGTPYELMMMMMMIHGIIIYVVYHIYAITRYYGTYMRCVIAYACVRRVLVSSVYMCVCVCVCARMRIPAGLA